MLKPPVFEYAVQLLLSAAILRIIFYKDYEICDIKIAPMKTGAIFVSYFLSAIWIGIFLFTVFAAVNFLCLIGEKEDLVEFLLNGSDAAWVFAPDDILYLFWHVKLFFLYNLGILDDIDRDVVVNESEDI